jgi:hypothetical protein
MKIITRNIFVAVFLGPLIVFAYPASIFMGRQNAIALVGPVPTRAAKKSLHRKKYLCPFSAFSAASV